MQNEELRFQDHTIYPIMMMRIVALSAATLAVVLMLGIGIAIYSIT